MAFLAPVLDRRDLGALPLLYTEATIRRQWREGTGVRNLDRLAQEHQMPAAAVREALAQGDHPILDRTTLGFLLGRFAGISAWVDDHVKNGTTSKLIDLSLTPAFSWPPRTIIDWGQRLQRDMRRLRPGQEAVVRAALRSVHALTDGADMLNQRLNTEELSRAVHAHAVQRGVLADAGSARAARMADRSVPLATRAAEALRVAGWENGLLARLTVRDIALVDSGQTVELGDTAPVGVRQHVGWRTGALLTALVAGRADDEPLFVDSSGLVTL